MVHCFSPSVIFPYQNPEHHITSLCDISFEGPSCSNFIHTVRGSTNTGIYFCFPKQQYKALLLGTDRAKLCLENLAWILSDIHVEKRNRKAS